MSEVITTIIDYPVNIRIIESPYIQITSSAAGVQGPPGNGGSSSVSGYITSGQVFVYVSGVSGSLQSQIDNQTVPDNIVFTTGYQSIVGIKNFTNGIVASYISGGETGLIDNNGVVSVDWNVKSLSDAGGSQSLDWGSRILKDAFQNYSIQYHDRLLRNSAQDYVLDWNNQILSGNWTKNGYPILSSSDSVVTGISILGSNVHLTGYVTFAGGNNDILVGQSTDGIVIFAPGIQQTGSRLYSNYTGLSGKLSETGHSLYSYIISSSGVSNASAILLENEINTLNNIPKLTGYGEPNYISMFSPTSSGLEKSILYQGNNGNIGLNISDPQYTLDIDGAIGNSNGDVSILAENGSLILSSENDISISSRTSIYIDAEGEIGNSNIILNGDDGIGLYVGIGTQAPRYILDVNGSGNFSNGLYVNDNTVLTGLIGGNNIIVLNNNNGTYTIVSSGATTSNLSSTGQQLYNLIIGGDTNLSGKINNQSGFNVLTYVNKSETGVFYLNSNPSGFGSFPSITDNGKIGINQINPQYALDVNGVIGNTTANNELEVVASDNGRFIVTDAANAPVLDININLGYSAINSPLVGINSPLVGINSPNPISPFEVVVPVQDVRLALEYNGNDGMQYNCTDAANTVNKTLFFNADNIEFFSNNASNVQKFNVHGVDVLYLNETSVGVFNISPIYALDVVGTVAANSGRFSNGLTVGESRVLTGIIAGTGLSVSNNNDGSFTVSTQVSNLSASLALFAYQNFK